MFKITLEDGKYTFINNNGVVDILRHGEKWDTGNKAVLALLHKIEEQQEEIESLSQDVEFLNCLEACGVDNWDGYSNAVEMFEEEGE